MDRALVVLAVACPERGWDELCALPVGERNRLLLLVRAAAFGPRLDIVTACPACGEQLEFEVELPVATFAPVSSRERRVEVGEGTIRLRLPDSRDLASVAQVAPTEAERQLVERCVIEHPGLPTADLALRLSEVVEEHDPLAAIAFPVRCEECGKPWRAMLDPIDYLWHELEQRVKAAIREVHLLARTYGWTEGEILRLSPARRRLYLEQVTA